MRRVIIFCALLVIASAAAPPPTAASSTSRFGGLFGGGAAAGPVIPGRFPIGPVRFQDSQPSVEIRLNPPKHPLPQVSSKIEVLERARRMTEERQMTKLLKAYNEEVKRSWTLISKLIREAFQNLDDPGMIPPPSSFFELPDFKMQPGRIWVSVEQPAPVDAAVLKRVEAIETKNAKNEMLLFQSAVEDMHEVTRHTLQQLNESLAYVMRPVIHAESNGTAYSSFIALQQATENRCAELKQKLGDDLVKCDGESTVSPHAHQISVFADEHTYPTVESLVQDMLKRREVDEDLFRARSLALMARLAQEQSQIVTDLLHAAVSTISIQYAPVIRSINMTRAELAEYERLHPTPKKPGTLPSNQLTSR